MAANGNGYVSDESTKVITNKVVFSITPKIAEPDPSDPLKIYEQNKTGFQLRIMPYSGNQGGHRCEFNITWPQYEAIACAVRQTLAGFDIGANWNLATIWDGDGHNEFDRVFGNPLPANELQQRIQNGMKVTAAKNGRLPQLCPARILVLRRSSTMPDGSKVRLPWYIKISNGFAEKISRGNGAFYMNRQSFVEEYSAEIRLSDAQMWEHIFWNEKIIDLFIQGAGPRVIAAQQQLQAKKQAAVQAKLQASQSQQATQPQQAQTQAQPQYQQQAPAQQYQQAQAQQYQGRGYQQQAPAPQRQAPAPQYQQQPAQPQYQQQPARAQQYQGRSYQQAPAQQYQQQPAQPQYQQQTQNQQYQPASGGDAGFAKKYWAAI